MAKERVERDEEDLVRLYLTDIGQYPLLTKDDEVRLAQAIEAGNTAREEMENATKELTAARKRELRRLSREGERAERTFVRWKVCLQATRGTSAAKVRSARASGDAHLLVHFARPIGKRDGWANVR